MNKDFWKDRAARGPIVALAPMDGYCDSAYRQVVKTVAPDVVPFSEFYSADGLVHSRELASRVLPHAEIEKPLIIQIFGKDPEKFAEAAKIIESYGVAGIDVNMGCPAKKVVKSGHGSSLMINRDTAFRIIEALAKAVPLPISVKTRLGWDNYEHLVEFCQGLENAGANLITVHGRTYQQKFTGKADWTGIHELKNHLGIPVVANGDVMGYDDGVAKMGNLDGFMIGRASFGNPWCFLPGSYAPTLAEILDMMDTHARLLIETKGRKGCLEIRKHLVQYIHAFSGVRGYRRALVSVESLEDVRAILATIRDEHASELSMRPGNEAQAARMEAWAGYGE